MMKPQCLGQGGEAHTKMGLNILITASNSQEAQDHPTNKIKCDECGRSFRRESDKKGHKCISE